MKKEKLLEKAIKHPDYLTLAGSHLYGTNTPESDIDYRGFVIPPIKYILGLSSFKHHRLDKDGKDVAIFSLEQFIKLLLKADPTSLEILYAPDQMILYRSRIAHEILQNKQLFLNQKFVSRILGYAESEFRKVQGVQLKPPRRTPTEDEIIENIRKIFQPPKEEMDAIIKLLFKHHKKELARSTRKMGTKRKKQIEQFGYCVSSASHSIRLLTQARELMQSGQLTFPRPNANYLKKIKLGQISLKEIQEYRNDLINPINNMKSKSHLPPKPKYKQIEDLYHDLMIKYI